MIDRIKKMVKGNQKESVEVKQEPADQYVNYIKPEIDIDREIAKSFQVDAVLRPITKDGFASDSVSQKLNYANPTGLPDPLVMWYAAQGFIGWQMASMLSQHWLISKACLMPAQDAVRKGFEITINDGTDVAPEVLDAMNKYDVKYNLTKNLIEFIQMGRIFGIRIALFVVDSDDPEYYEKPFNIDGVTPGSYRGISQIDPYWMTPQLDGAAAGDPGSINFYEPEWWKITGKLIHRTHLVIYRTEEVPDILKPTYFYGGIPIPQKIYERVYAAERTANEAPMLAMTKRTDVLKTDMSMALAKQRQFEMRLGQFAANRDNYGIKTVGIDEELTRLDTSLADLDAVIMTQYQIVAAAAGVPAVKLLGTSPKGFNATGEYEESSYHEMLESLQEAGLTALVERHHAILIRSEIAPEFGIAPFDTSIRWNELDAMTAEEQAALNKLKADTDLELTQTGAIDAQDIRDRLIADPNSGYNGLDNDVVIESEQSGLEDV